MKFISQLVDSIETRRFVGWSELLVLILIIVTYLFPFFQAPIPQYVFLSLLAFIIIITTLQLFFGEHSLGGISAVGGFFIYVGIAMFVLQLETIYGQGYVHFVNLLSMATSGMASVVGLVIVKSRSGRLQRKTLTLLFWNISLLMILYLPLSHLFFTVVGTGEGELTFIGLGTALSVIFAFYYIKREKSSDIVAREIDEGISRRLLGDIAGARENFDKAIRNGSKKAYTLLGDVEFGEGRYTEALNAYVRAEDNERNARRISLTSLALGMKEQAQRYAAEALKSNTSPQNWYMLGLSFRSMGDKKREVRCYQEALEMDPDHWPSLEGLALLGERTDIREAFLRGGYEPEKRILLKKLRSGDPFLKVILHPADPEVWKTDEEDKELDDVLLQAVMERFDLTKDMELCGEDERRFIQGLKKASRGDDEAHRIFRSLEDSWFENEALFATSALHTVKGDYDKAIDVLKTIDDPSIAPTSFQLMAAIHRMKDELYPALEYYRKTMALGHSKKEVADALAGVAGELSLELEAAQAHAFKPDLPIEMLTGRNESLEDMVEMVEARKETEIPSPLKEDHRLFGAFAELLSGKLPQTVESFEDVLDEDPANPMAELGLSICSYASGDLEDALDHVEKAIGIGGKDPLFSFYRGRILYSLGQKEKSLGELEYVYKQRPAWNRNVLHLERVRSDLK